MDKLFLEVEVREFVKQELPLITHCLFFVVELKDDSVMQDFHSQKNICLMLKRYSEYFNVSLEGIVLDSYFPWKRKKILSMCRNNSEKKPITVEMLIESAKAGFWLYS